MTTPTALDVTAVLDRYRAGLRTVSDAELERRAATVAALPGRLADELRHLVDAERDRRQAARRPAPSTPAPGRSRALRAAAGTAVAGAPVAVLAGRALADYAGQVPQALVYSPAVAAGLVAVAVGGSRLARWIDDRRHPLAVDVDEADLDPYGKELLARVRAQRLARGEVC
ncbi:hypothetical protein [Micromonospora sp. NPDC048830]|uniref:hypothetical protein n=1 Tax=Micromonospora sp. NPDC048830 TaxID=3364257 RepID=UPI00371CE0F8